MTPSHRDLYVVSTERRVSTPPMWFSALVFAVALGACGMLFYWFGELALVPISLGVGLVLIMSAARRWDA